MFRVKSLLIYFIPVFVLFLAQGCGSEKTTQQEINAGKPFTVIFNNFDIDLGTVAPNSSLEVQLKNGKFVATGIAKGQTSPQTASYSLLDSGVTEASCPKCISVWGGIFEYDEHNNLLKDKKIIGRIVLKEN